VLGMAAEREGQVGQRKEIGVNEKKGLREKKRGEGGLTPRKSRENEKRSRRAEKKGEGSTPVRVAKPRRHCQDASGRSEAGGKKYLLAPGHSIAR